MSHSNSNEHRKSFSPSSDIAFIERVMRFQDQALSPEELLALDAELIGSPEKRELFIELQLQSSLIFNELRQQAYISPDHSNGRERKCSIWKNRKGWILLAICLLLMGFVIPLSYQWTSAPSTLATSSSNSDSDTIDAALPFQVRMIGASQASFFGELVPPLQSIVVQLHDYALMQGIVELAFPDGATAVIEAPAMFRVEDNECLVLNSGRCSIHAPDGAEGFRVETPVTRVVDRGTRFHVNVGETFDTEVQVIEGIADVYRKPRDRIGKAPGDQELPLEVRLEYRDALRFNNGLNGKTVPVDFSAEHYRGGLPDRLVQYQATTSQDGGVEELLSVTVQRDGRNHHYAVDELIPIQLTAFKSYPTVDRSGYFISGDLLPERRAELLEDRLLNTGIINPGGQAEPLQSDPIVQDPEDPDRPNTPGFAIRFRTPVVNGPGPDVVFFEVQTLSNPPAGDGFHVSPMRFIDNRRTLTVKSYDLAMFSREAKPLAPFSIYALSKPVNTLAELQAKEYLPPRYLSGFRLLATGIDLSEMGFRPNEKVQELFFQDSSDDGQNYVDPVFIAGLPKSLPGEQKND